MRWWQDVIGLVGALGVGGYVGGLLDRRHAAAEAQNVRDHATAEARAERLFKARFDSYMRISVYLERLSLWVNLTEPDISSGLEPPDVSPDDTWIQVGAAVGLAASDGVREVLRASREAVSGFEYAVAEVRDSPHVGWSQEPDNASPRVKLHRARQRATESIQAAQTAMRDELVSL